MKNLQKVIGVIFSFMIGTALFAKAPFNISDADYKLMMKESLVSTGNNYRLKCVLEKMKSGEKVWVAALGGSVTEGAGPEKFTDGYAYQFFRMLQKKYTPNEGKNLFFNNAGLSGTPSLLGMIRYQADVVEVCGGNPDLLIVEFAVNDEGNETMQKSFEAIIRKALEANPKTAVIALYNAAEYGNTMAQKKPVADYYQIPQVNILKIVNDAISSKKIKKEEFFTDNVHPTLNGHTLVMDCLINLCETVDNAQIDKPALIPEKLYKNPGFDNFVRVFGDDKNIKISKGAFTAKDNNTQSLKKTNKGDFPENWHKNQGSKNDTFVVEADCKNFLLTYKVQGSWLTEVFGKADIYVDGKLFKTVEGNAKGGWNNNETLLLVNDVKSGKHKIEVKMASGDEKKAFTIVAMGYSK